MKQPLYTVPSTSKKTWPADIKQKLESYNQSKEDHKNHPPHIRPHPLEKYATSKESRVERLGDEDEEEMEGDGEGTRRFDLTMATSATAKQRLRDLQADASALDHLPSKYIVKGRRLLPHLRRLGLDQLGVPLKDLLYDLTSDARVRTRTRPIEVLTQAVHTLDADPLVPQSFYQRKVGRRLSAVFDKTPQRHGPTATSTPMRRQTFMPSGPALDNIPDEGGNETVPIRGQPTYWD